MVDPRHTAPRDLIGDIQAQQRRKLFRRVALVVALFLVLLLIALALKYLADRRHRDGCLEDAREGFARGTSADLVATADELDTCLEEHPEDPLLLGAVALTRAQLLAEFGQDNEAAHAATDKLDAVEASHDGELARVMLELDDGELTAARERLPTVADLEDKQSIAPNHEVWVQGMLAIADPEANIDEAIDKVTNTVAEDPSISIRRLLAALHMHAGDAGSALDELGRLREQSRSHYGLAADEALYNALLRQKLAGVAGVADDLLSGEFDISRRDRAHALLARGVVSIHSGEIDEGMKLVDEAWGELPGWDKISRALALEMAMEAGDGERARKWIDEAGLREPESDIYAAWVKLVEGDVMGALEDLAKLPQTHPRVALLQGLALVEQNRWAEAKPWLDRAEQLLAGRVDVEVARARVEAHTGDPEAARRKLEAIAEEEPFAPRAWTGLGEANLAVAWREVEPAAKADGSGKPDQGALREARRAFKKAVERERQPAEAYLHLAELTDRKRREGDPALVPEVIELLGKAVAANDKLPRYAEREALYLAEVALRRQAMDKLEAVLDRPGVSYRVPLARATLALDQIEFEDRDEIHPKFDAWLEEAVERKAPEGEVQLLRARALLEQDKPKEVIEALQPRIDAEENSPKLWALYAQAQLDARDREAAIDAVRRGRSVVDDDDLGVLSLQMSAIMTRGGKRKAAANHAKTAWKQLSKQEDASVTELILGADQVVWTLHRDQALKPAASVGRELTELVPFHSDAWVIRANAELRTNRGSDAKASAEKAVELDDESARAHDMLGQLWLRFGRKDNARQEFEKALELAQGTPREKDIKKNLAAAK